MFDKKIREQLKVLLPEFPVIIGEASLHHDIDDLVALALPAMRFGVVDDVNTGMAFGNRVFRAVKGRFECIHITLADAVEADDKAVDYIRGKAASCDALIAVGGGTINDLCKYAAHLDNKPYIIFPTAASMNGYLSANASITIKSHKTTLPAILPKAVFCDLGVIANAPVRLSKSGLGDSLARPTAQADWLLSHLILDTHYDERPFSLLNDIEPELFDDAGGIAKNDFNALKTLMKLLLLSGTGMTIAGGSYPASQGEHKIAHTYNMLKKSSKKFKTLHGEEIAVTALYMAKRQETLLKLRYCHPHVGMAKGKFDKDYLSELFGNSLAEEFAVEFTKKQNLISQFQQGWNAKNWDNIREKIEAVMLMPDQVLNIINKASLSATPEEIGWNGNDFATACDTARFTRDRFTFLDME